MATSPDHQMLGFNRACTDHHGNPEGYARQGIIRRHIEAATSHNIIESNELQASATANEQSGFHSCELYSNCFTRMTP